MHTAHKKQIAAAFLAMLCLLPACKAAPAPKASALQAQEAQSPEAQLSALQPSETQPPKAQVSALQPSEAAPAAAQSSEPQTAEPQTTSSAAQEADAPLTLARYQCSQTGHTMALCGYDGQAQTLTLLFDERTLVTVYRCIYEPDFGADSALYEGFSTPESGDTIDLLYYPQEDRYQVSLGVGGIVLLYEDADYSGSYLPAGEAALPRAALAAMLPASPTRAASASSPATAVCRVNGSWSLYLNPLESQNLLIFADGTFLLTRNDSGEIKNALGGTYEIIADDGEAQTLRFTSLDDPADTWTASLRQTTYLDEGGFSHTALVYVSESGQSSVYTGIQWE